MPPAPERDDRTPNGQSDRDEQDEGPLDDDAPWWGHGKPAPPYYVNARQEAYVRERLEPFVTDTVRSDTARFFRHVLVSSILGLTAARDPSYGRTDRDREERSQGYVPVDSKFIEKHFRKCRRADRQALLDAGLIEVLPYNVEKELAYRYRPAPAFVETFNRLGVPESAEDAARIAKEGRVNVTSGRRSRKAVKTRRKYDKQRPSEPPQAVDEKGRAYPDLVSAGVRAMEPCPVVYGAADSNGILRHLRLRYDQLLSTGWRPGDPVPHPKWQPSQSRAYHRLANDERCAAALLMQGFRHVEGGLAIYQPAYRIISSGRTAQADGGLQSCSGEMKAAAYGNLAAYGYDVRNYDMVAAHLNLFAAFMREARLAADWMEKYLTVQRARPFYAGAVEMDEKTWKRLTLALVMAAHVPTPAEVADRKLWWQLRGVTLVDAIDEAAWAFMEAEGLIRRVDEGPGNGEADSDGPDSSGTDGDTSKRGALTEKSKDEYWYVRAGLYRKFYLFTRDMRDGIERWQRHLLETLVEGGTPSTLDGRVYVTNKAGMRKGIEQVPEDEAGRRQLAAELAAFMLQGAEAAVIHALASLGKKYGFSPVANEHDGLVTLGPVPAAAVKEAAIMADVDPAAVTLEEKPFKEPLA